MHFQVDSTGNPKELATTLREILSDTIEKSLKRPESPEPRPPTAVSAPAVAPIITNLNAILATEGPDTIAESSL